MEKGLNVWCNHWLYRGGTLALVKVALEVISVHWITLAWISKRIPKTIRRISFRFIWPSGREKMGIPLGK
jgi:hypothetical protein